MDFSHRKYTTIIFILFLIMMNIALYIIINKNNSFIFSILMTAIVNIGYIYHFYTSYSTPIREYQKEYDELRRVESLASVFLPIAIGMAVFMFILKREKFNDEHVGFLSNIILFAAVLIGFSILPLWAPNDDPKFIRYIRDAKTYVFTGGMTFLATALMFQIYKTRHYLKEPQFIGV